ncbi:MAG: hypothetical protein ACK4TS_03795 [Aquabacterium sp.]|jgi:hypothetical protein
MKALRMLRPIRSAACTLFMVLMACLGGAQAGTCSSHPHQVVVYFGNGINTSPESAERSMLLLRRNLGTTYNDKALRYDLAYNATDGMVDDLKQAAQQAGIQWTSDLANWLIRERRAPPWFNRWHRLQIERFTLGLLPEVDQHVDSYRHAIAQGQSVLVVAHSQGNFYANDARRLLQSQLSPEQLRRFAIHGVAVPANNVGGEPGPYLTNHRDFITVVPGALPANFTLRRGAGGASADDVGAIQAHLFNDTYLSDDFNVKQTLLQGLRAVLDRFQAEPPASCQDEVRAYILGLVGGSYTCFAIDDQGDEVPVGQATVGADGRISVQSKGMFVGASGQVTDVPSLTLAFDVTHPDVLMDISGPSTAQGFAIRLIRYYETLQEVDGPTPVRTAKLLWGGAGEFEGFSITEGDVSGLNQHSVSCDPTRRRPNSQIIQLPEHAQLWAGAMSVLTGPRRLRFESGQCAYLNTLRPLQGPVEVDMSAQLIRINEVEISGLWPGQGDSGLAYQRVSTGAGDFHQVDDFLPRLSYSVGDDSAVSLLADAARGLYGLTVSYADAGLNFSCYKPAQTEPSVDR